MILEIYEGDILKLEKRNIVVEIPDIYEFDYGNGLGRYAEVIGNIYENPELLEKEPRILWDKPRK